MTLDHENIDAIAERAAHRVVQLLEQPGPGTYQLLGLSSTSYVPSTLFAASEPDPAADPTLPNADAELARLAAGGLGG